MPLELNSIESEIASLGRNASEIEAVVLCTTDPDKIQSLVNLLPKLKALMVVDTDSDKLSQLKNMFLGSLAESMDVQVQAVSQSDHDYSVDLYFKLAKFLMDRGVLLNRTLLLGTFGAVVGTSTPKIGSLRYSTLLSEPSRAAFSSARVCLISMR